MTRKRSMENTLLNEQLKALSREFVLLQPGDVRRGEIADELTRLNFVEASLEKLPEDAKETSIRNALRGVGAGRPRAP